LFSLKHGKDEFIQYLSGLEKDHVTPVSPKTLPAFETERFADFRQHRRLVLWICFIPTHPDELIRSKLVEPRDAPDSLIECRILAGGGIEWVEAIADTTSISTDKLESLIQRALHRIFTVPIEGSHVSMRINYSLANCAEVEIENHSTPRSRKIRTNSFWLGVSDWLTDSRDVLWPPPNEILAALFQPERARQRTNGHKESAAPSGLG